MNIHREIIKVLTGLGELSVLADSEMPVCTGRWGCGAFKGDIYLKFIIQWIACSIAKRSMIFMCNDEKELKELGVMIRFLSKHDTAEVLDLIN